MAQAFPNHPNLIGGFAPIQMECDAPDLIIEGEVPKDLVGTFYRNGPNPQFAPRGEHHWFAGDGMLHAFHIENGKVSYKNRYARTVKWGVEREAGRSLFGAFNPMDNDASVEGLQTDGIANTNIIWHGGKLLALEEGHVLLDALEKALIFNPRNINAHAMLSTLMSATKVSENSPVSQGPSRQRGPD